MNTKIISILEHMIEDSKDILDFIQTTSSSLDLEKNRMCKKAITQSLLNLGENTKILEKEINIVDTNIDWKGLKGLREIAAHRYHTIDSNIIWNISVNEIPEIHGYLTKQLMYYQKLQQLQGRQHHHSQPGRKIKKSDRDAR